MNATNSGEQILIKQFTANWHLNLIEWVLEDVVCVKLIDPAWSKDVRASPEVAA